MSRSACYTFLVRNYGMGQATYKCTSLHGHVYAGNMGFIERHCQKWEAGLCMKKRAAYIFGSTGLSASLGHVGVSSTNLAPEVTYPGF